VRTLNCLGRPCPVPIIELARALAEVQVGELLEVWSDDPAAAADVPAWCRMRGQQYDGMRALPVGAGYRVRRLS